MNQNNLFAEDMPSVPLLAVSKEKGLPDDVAPDELGLIVQKKKRVFLSVIFVLIFLVTLNVVYLLYSPESIASVVITIFFINFAILAALYYLKKKSVSRDRPVMTVVDHEDASNPRNNET